jgi:CTP:molybdopterin cytidylyltransferase MocA
MPLAHPVARGDVMTRAVRTALVLAAGNGDRFKNPTRESKLLQPVLGRPLIIRTIETALTTTMVWPVA